MSIKSFEDILDQVESRNINVSDDDLIILIEFWNSAIETCSTIAHDCTELQIASECNGYQVEINE